MDPEQVYSEVLQEEQGKGSSPAVAEARAKAARQRAAHGSPHPKEPKWWPGAQPQFEGDGAAPAAEEPVEQEEPAAEEPAEEQPAAAAPEPEPEPAPAPAEQPAAAAPAEQPAAAAPAAAVATAPAPAVPAPAAAYQPTIGAMPGSPTGNRLRPEDAVATEAQFDAQKAMDRRRKLIDELVSSGVPAVTAADTGRRPSGWVSVLFLLVPLLAILFLVGNDDLRAPAAAGGETEQTEEQPPGGEGGNVVVSQNFEFSPNDVTVSGEVELDNRDSTPHNIYIYPDEESAEAADASQAIFQGEDAAGNSSVTYDLADVEAGTYPFICQLHPNMQGTITIE